MPKFANIGESDTGQAGDVSWMQGSPTLALFTSLVPESTRFIMALHASFAPLLV